MIGRRLESHSLLQGCRFRLRIEFVNLLAVAILDYLAP